MRLIAIIFFAVLVMQAARASEHEHQRSIALPIVEMTFDGQPLRVRLDLISPGLVLSPEAVERLGLQDQFEAYTEGPQLGFLNAIDEELCWQYCQKLDEKILTNRHFFDGDDFDATFPIQLLSRDGRCVRYSVAAATVEYLDSESCDAEFNLVQRFGSVDIHFEDAGFYRYRVATQVKFIDGSIASGIIAPSAPGSLLDRALAPGPSEPLCAEREAEDHSISPGQPTTLLLGSEGRTRAAFRPWVVDGRCHPVMNDRVKALLGSDVFGEGRVFVFRNLENGISTVEAYRR